MIKIEDVYHILESVPEPDDAILIDGQALNFWVEYYAKKDPSLNTYTPFFSQDIDFLGGKDTADDLHEVWKGKIIKPSKDSYTPITAKLEFRLKDGRRVSVDFLEVMIGVDNDHIRKEARTTKNPYSQKSLKVLHPRKNLSKFSILGNSRDTILNSTLGNFLELSIVSPELVLLEKGKPIGFTDTMIASHALMTDATLVTNNQGHFSQVEGLRLENWFNHN